MADPVRASRGDDRDAGAPRGTPESEPGLTSLLTGAQALVHEALGSVSDRLALFSLELQRARRALTSIVVFAAVAALLAFTAWGLMWVGIVAGIAALGLHVAWAFALAAAVNVLAAGIAAWRIRKLIPLLQLPATRRHLWPTQNDQDNTHDPSTTRATARSAAS